jgi:Ca2+-binding EF-hand superfamily protein
METAISTWKSWPSSPGGLPTSSSWSDWARRRHRLRSGSSRAPKAPAPFAHHLKKLTVAAVALQLANIRLEFRAEQTPAIDNKAVADNRRQNYKARFKNADEDNNGYIDRTEAQRDPFFSSLFTYLDQDGDGKIFEKEMFAYLDKIESVQAKAQSSTASMEIFNQGQGLFDLLDTNGDGRLGLREMRNAVHLLDSLDADGDGHLSRTEIPRNYVLRLRQGPLNVNLQPASRVVSGYSVQQKPVSEPTAGPLWFRKMDRNRDGDVSRREFLGSAEDFARIDTDGDGLISAEEADRADKALRK